MIVSRDILGFSTTSNMRRIMDINGFYVSIMRADKKSDDNGGLPPGIPIPVLPVDFLKSKPDFWIGGQGSYVCPIESDWALWFNWTMNKRDVSILTSVKGMNPLTGQRINGLGLEQYVENCPVHNTVLQHGRFCPLCNFKWPNQNYISNPNPFYLDGFRSADGVVRQFYFTEDMAKSVPEKVIGKDDTVPAFGFCFYNLKEQTANYEEGKRLKNKFPVEFTRSQPRCVRPALFDGESIKGMTLGKSRGSTYTLGGSTKMLGGVMPGVYTRMVSDGGPIGASSSTPDESSDDISAKNSGEATALYHSSLTSDSLSRGIEISADGGSDILKERSVRSMRTKSFRHSTLKKMSYRSPSAEVGIGAGAKIKQRFEKDRHSIEEWREKPSGIVRIYFVFREQFEKYASEGLHDLTGCKEGYLEGVPVGGTK